MWPADGLLQIQRRPARRPDGGVKPFECRGNLVLRKQAYTVVHRDGLRMVEIVKVDDVKRMMESDDEVVVVDALGPESFNLRHLPDAVNVPAGADRVDELIKQRLPDDKSVPIIAYCADKDCDASPALAKRLEEEHGYTKVYEFEDGLQGWHQAGEEFERPTQEPKPV